MKKFLTLIIHLYSLIYFDGIGQVVDVVDIY